MTLQLQETSIEWVPDYCLLYIQIKYILTVAAKSQFEWLILLHLNRMSCSDDHTVAVTHEPIRPKRSSLRKR